MIGLFKTKKQKIREDCWDLDIAGMHWLEKRLPIYLEECENVVDLEYHTFEYNGGTHTQKEMVEGLIMMIDEYFNNWNRIADEEGGSRLAFETESYYLVEVWKVWALIASAMWI